LLSGVASTAQTAQEIAEARDRNAKARDAGAGPDYKGDTSALHPSSQSVLGHATVVDTDGSALNRLTYQYLVRTRDPEDFKEHEDYQDIQERVTEARKRITDLEKQEDKKNDPDHQEELAAARAEHEEAMQERHAFLENYFRENQVTLTDQEKAELRQHLEKALAEEYPNSLQSQKGENGADVFKNSSGELHSKVRDDGKYELSTNGSKFSGVVRVPRVDASGKELDDCDIIEYHEGRPISIVAGREGKTNVHDFDKLLQTSKSRGVTVASAEEEEPATPRHDPALATPRQPQQQQQQQAAATLAQKHYADYHASKAEQENDISTLSAQRVSQEKDLEAQFKSRKAPPIFGDQSQQQEYQARYDLLRPEQQRQEYLQLLVKVRQGYQAQEQNMLQRHQAHNAAMEQQFKAQYEALTPQDKQVYDATALNIKQQQQQQVAATAPQPQQQHAAGHPSPPPPQWVQHQQQQPLTPQQQQHAAAVVHYSTMTVEVVRTPRSSVTPSGGPGQQQTHQRSV
jgi:hypothetical protein